MIVKYRLKNLIRAIACRREIHNENSEATFFCVWNQQKLSFTTNFIVTFLTWNPNPKTPIQTNLILINMPTAQRNAKAREKKDAQAMADKTQHLQEECVEVDVDVDEVMGKVNDEVEEHHIEERNPIKVAVYKLVFDYLVSENLGNTARYFLKDANIDQSVFLGCEQGEDLASVYASYLDYRSSQCEGAYDEKRLKKRNMHDLLSGVADLGDEEGGMGKDELLAKKKRKRSTGQKREGSLLDGPEGMLVMKEESQKQYTFGWKRYTEYCQMHSLDPLVGQVSPATQILEFARYLMQNPGKTVKSAVANSYVSAVGKKLLEAGVIAAMRDIRTPELKELFAEAGRASVAAAAAAVYPTSTTTGIVTTTIATSSTAAPVPLASVANSDSESEFLDAKKKKRV